MKTDTVIKVLKRYSKSLQAMAQEAVKQEDLKDAEHYSFDRFAFEEAIRILEERKE